MRPPPHPTTLTDTVSIPTYYLRLLMWTMSNTYTNSYDLWVTTHVCVTTYSYKLWVNTNTYNIYMCMYIFSDRRRLGRQSLWLSKSMPLRDPTFAGWVGGKIEIHRELLNPKWQHTEGYLSCMYKQHVCCFEWTATVSTSPTHPPQLCTNLIFR